MRVYFDNASTTMVRKEAVDLMCQVMQQCYGNPSSTHEMGRQAKKYLEQARENVASVMGAKGEDIYFTSGGSEADNWAVFGLSQLLFRKGKHIITTAVEHDAINKPIAKLIQQGWEVTKLLPDESGRVSAQDFADALRDDTVFASIMLVNNETGARNPIEKISQIIKKRGTGTILHTDAVQAYCKVPFNVKTLGADLITVSSHKINGPKGCGALYINSSVKLPPYIMGGMQEKGRRAGTEAMPAIVGFGQAAALGKEEMEENAQNMRLVRQRIIDGVKAQIQDVVVIGSADAPHILSLSLPGYRSEVLMNCLEQDGIYVSKSSACKKGARSHVLEAMNLPAKVIDGAIRISFSKYSTVQQADYFVQCLVAAANRLIKVK